VVALAMRGKLPMDEIRAEIERQLTRFEAVMERRPDFVDGHQHVHGLPAIGEALLDAMSERRLAGRAWVRDAGDSLHRIMLRRAHVRKALTVRALNAPLERAARWRGFSTNDSFAGFSDFDAGKDYGRAFETYLRAPGRRHLVMCHPGHVDDELKALDPVTITREQELAFLLLPRLPEMLARHGLTLARLGPALRGEAQPVAP
jgi:predicted glycoside hydrolase/deacetylase ChbG (UPF0249 family)